MGGGREKEDSKETSDIFETRPLSPQNSTPPLSPKEHQAPLRVVPLRRTTSAEIPLSLRWEMQERMERGEYKSSSSSTEVEYQHQEERPPTPSLLWELCKCTIHCANMAILTTMLLTALIAIIVLLG
jgi:hypothetical protein